MKLLRPSEVLTMLNIKKKDVITWLVQRDELPRIELGPKTFRYEEKDVLKLIERVKTQGLIIYKKP